MAVLWDGYRCPGMGNGLYPNAQRTYLPNYKQEIRLSGYFCGDYQFRRQKLISLHVIF